MKQDKTIRCDSIGMRHSLSQGVLSAIPHGHHPTDDHPLMTIRHGRDSTLTTIPRY
jgi:hypothetical protein